MSDNTLGEYLRARRALVRPEDAGLRVTGVRRTPGLRREEVATLAGISADYYLRLEQGRDRNPSGQVLDAIARVFGLDATATAYLRGLASASGSSAAAPDRARGSRGGRSDRVPTGTLQLLDVVGLPAFVENRAFDVLAANRLASALAPGMRAGENRLRTMFLGHTEQGRYPDWEQQMGGMVAAFRSSIGTRVDDPAITSLVGELSLGSEDFRRLWARHDVRPLAGGTVRMWHPEVGELELRREKLGIGGTDGQLLVLHHAEPGSPSAGALALLGSLAAGAAGGAGGAAGDTAGRLGTTSSTSYDLD
ncbi:transcriptional regulator [Curtobacterium sp. BH-2-1-1]|uniref:helix-turn-helix domain-containing protein n=1 Tax=Curtobacterium sp. BH-2-1-1 TaxID=1905847 RepID=UPI00089E072D|nr:helix-turn-helix domain-containing protein [Curtobacterium sp. BH-2-1-1]AOX64721.1 transcriptional regulator [Curtobacterium sp. BH-2-1-1]